MMSQAPAVTAKKAKANGISSSIASVFAAAVRLGGSTGRPDSPLLLVAGFAGDIARALTVSLSSGGSLFQSL